MNKLLIALLLCGSQSILFSMSQEQLNEALRNTSYRGNVEQVQNLLQSGANANAQDAFGRTPLHLAAMGGQAEAVKLLLQAGAGVNAQNELGYTPLHVAARHGYTEIVKLLLQAGANIDAQDNYGKTSLHLAALSGYTEVAKLLLERGADSTIKNKDGKTALESTYDQTKKLLKDYQELREIKEKESKGEKVNYHELFIKAMETGNLIVVQYLLLKLPLNEVLMDAVLNRRASVVKYLLANILWSEEVLVQAFGLAKASYASTQDKTYQEIGRMLLEYLKIIGPQGLLSKHGLAPVDIDLPEEIKQVIASHFFKLGRHE